MSASHVAAPALLAQQPTSDCVAAASRPAFDADVAAALAQTTDFSFAYAQPGFFALLSAIKSGTLAPGETSPAVELSSWNDLLDRPADFRGIAVTIRGTVGRNTSWQFQDPERQSLGPVWELQLTSRDTPLICKAILTQSAADVPVGSEVTLTGCFVMIQQFYSESRQLRHAAILVGVGPTRISRAAPTTTHVGPSATLVVSLALAGFALALVLPRVLARPRHELHELRAARRPDANVADEFERWARRQDGDA